MRPAGRLCTELHRHLTTAQDAEDAPAPDTEEEEDEEEDEDSESEEDEEESSSSEVESASVISTAPVVPAKPQFSSEKELHSVVELITYMHTYCLPTRKRQGWERKDRDLTALARSRARHEAPRPAANSHSRVVLVATLGTGGGLHGTGNGAPKRLPFARRREMKANSLLRELLQQSSSFDVSKPYRLHGPPYTHPHSLNRGGVPNASASGKSAPAQSPNSNPSKPELQKDSLSLERRNLSSPSETPQSTEENVEDGASFSVRRSRRLASFPSRFGKRLRPGHARGEDVKDKVEKEEGRSGVKLLPTQAGGGTTTEPPAEQLTLSDSSANHTTVEPTTPCCHSGKVDVKDTLTPNASVLFHCSCV